jgi:hypothetical protein
LLSEIGLITKVGGGLVLLLAVAFGCYKVHHAGYVSGQAERTAYYAPLMLKSAQALVVADTEADKLTRAATDITANVEQQHEQNEKLLGARATAAEQRITQLLQQRAPACTTAGSGQVPAVSAGAGGTTGPGGGQQRDAALATGVSSVGAACERDAERLNRWVQWYNTEAAALKQQ